MVSLFWRLLAPLKHMTESQLICGTSPNSSQTSAMLIFLKYASEFHLY